MGLTAQAPCDAAFDSFAMAGTLSTKPRHLGVILLLAALTLLQIRVAFAGCFTSDSALPEAAAQCCLMPGGNAAQAMPDRGVPARLCDNQCVRPSAPQESKNNVFASLPENPAWIREPRVPVYAAATIGSSSRRFLMGPPVTHRLIYHLQRLLI